jgi:hypothetical protein
VASTRIVSRSLSTLTALLCGSVAGVLLLAMMVEPQRGPQGLSRSEAQSACRAHGFDSAEFQGTWFCRISHPPIPNTNGSPITTELVDLRMAPDYELEVMNVRAERKGANR